MKRTILLVLAILVLPIFAYAQDNLNDYKYIIVPNQFDFLKGKDKYQVNSLTAFLFNKYGYTAFMEGDEFPKDLRNNRCLGLTSEVVEAKGGFLSTRLQINLVNCDGKIVMSSRVGETKEKTYEKAYGLAIRDAFVSFQEVNHVYKPNPELVGITTSNKAQDTDSEEEISNLKKEIETLKAEKELANAVVAEEVSTNAAAVTTGVVATKTVLEPVDQKVQIENPSNVKEDVLFAQPIDNGFQLVDMEPKKVMVLLYTAKKDVFIVQGKDAIVFKKGEQWVISENTETKFSAKVLNIKF